MFFSSVLQTHHQKYGFCTYVTLYKIIKLLWNHYLDKEFLLGDGTIIDPSIAREVLERDEGEIKLCYKLKSQILTVKGNERQKVAPAKNFILRDNSKNNQTFNWEWIEHQISF